MPMWLPATPKSLAVSAVLFISGAVLFGVGVHLSYVNVEPQQAFTRARINFLKAELSKKYGYEWPDD